MNRSKSHSTSLPHFADRFVLVAAMCFGAAGIIVIKQRILPIIPEDPQHLVALIAAIWTAFILLLYAIIVQTSSRSQVEPETIGDNCYYLGFLFTLVSLAVTLFELGFSTVQSEILREIISGFGIALTSTVIGIALRVWYFQQRSDIVARDRENQIEVQRAVREFRNALSESTVRFKQFATESVQLTVERDAKLRKSADSIIDGLSSVAKDSSRALEEIHKSVFEGTKATLAELESSVGRLTLEVDSLRQSNLDAISDFQDKVDRVLKAFETNAGKIGDVVETSLVKGFARAADDIHKEIIDNSGPAFREFQKSIEQLASEVVRTIGALSKYGKKSSDVLVQLDTISKKTVENVNASQEQHESVMSGFEKSADHIASQLERLSKQIVDKAHEGRKIQDSSSVSIQQKLENIERSIDNLRTDLNNLGQSAGELGERLDQASKGIEDVVSSSNTTFTEFGHSVQKIAQALERINQIDQAISPDRANRITERIVSLNPFRS